MQLKRVEVSLSKEEQRMVDEYGNTASTWARIGITADLEEGDLPDRCIQLLKEEIQPQVDNWLLAQDGYLALPQATPDPAPLAPSDIDQFREIFDEKGIQVVITEQSDDGQEIDEIPE